MLKLEKGWDYCKDKGASQGHWGEGAAEPQDGPESCQVPKQSSF